MSAAGSGVWRKLVAGSPHRISRLHDAHGTRIGVSRLCRSGPRALVGAMARLAFGWRPARPWISYDATRVLAARLGPGARVLEFGAGTSTLWFARRAAEVVSIEHDPVWHGIVAARLARARQVNVRLRCAHGRTDYVTLSRQEAGTGFDLVLIDGPIRDRCAAAAIDLVRPGGVIYLDNADRGGEDGDGATAVARATLLTFAADRGATATFFTDFAPAQFFVGSGLLVTVPTAE